MQTPIVAYRSKMVTRRTKLPFGPPKSDRHDERSLKLGRSRTVIVFKNILKFLKGVTFCGGFLAVFLVDIDLGDRKSCIKFVKVCPIDSRTAANDGDDYFDQSCKGK